MTCGTALGASVFRDLFRMDTVGHQQHGNHSCALSDICEVPSSSLAFFSDDAVDSLCQRLGHDKLKTLVNTLEDTMKARWQAAEAANSRPQTEDWSHCDVHRPLYIQGLPPLYRSVTSLLTDA
jgi:hypothetical protein